MIEALGTIMQSGNITRVAKAKYEQSRETRVASNKLKAAQGTLADWSRSLGNRRRMQAAEANYNRGMESLVHELGQGTKAIANVGLQRAAEVGALNAQAAFTGVGGTSVELMETLVNLQMATSESEQMKSLENMKFYGKYDAASVIRDAALGFDMNRTVQGFDYGWESEPKDISKKWLKVAGVAAATIFGGPMAGQAAAETVVAEWQYQNGDIQGGNRSAGNAAAAGMQAIQDWNERRQATNREKDQFVSWRASGAGSGSYTDLAIGTSAKKTKTQNSSSWGGWFN